MSAHLNNAVVVLVGDPHRPPATRRRSNRVNKQTALVTVLLPETINVLVALVSLPTPESTCAFIGGLPCRCRSSYSIVTACASIHRARVLCRSAKPLGDLLTDRQLQ